MFKDPEKTNRMVQGAYRKLKSYYYYNKNFLIMRKKIAAFEEDPASMYAAFENITMALCHPVKFKGYVEGLVSHIDFYAIPKKFDAEPVTGTSIISNTISRNKKMKTVNFFIDAPIELHILDSLWTVFLGKMDNDKKILSYEVYGNTINKSSLYMDDDINFDSRILFNRYFNNYSNWRNRAFETLEDQYRFKRDSILVSLDIKSYFYSVEFSFGKLSYYFDNHELLKKIRHLTAIIEKIYATYLDKIRPYRRDMDNLKKGHYPLPIGLFSSMVIGNVYLHDFDKCVAHTNGIMNYGRYVDDLLIVVDHTMKKGETSISVLEDTFVKTGIFKKDGTSYSFVDYPGLTVQQDKIKLLYIDHTESKAILDIYNDTIKVVPSQMDPLPDSNISVTNFDEVAYSIENFTKEKKIRDIGLIGIDSFKVSRFFSALPRKYSQIDLYSIKGDISNHIRQIEKFFTGSQSIEFYSNWLNYMYFLSISERSKALHTFIADTKRQINELKANSLDKAMYNKTATINKKAKEYLQAHLETCLYLALCLNSSFSQKHFKRDHAETRRYIHANMFDHSFVTFPLANYLDYQKEVSFCKMSLNDLGEYPERLEESFKFIWSPRFVHYDELLLLLFYHYHNQNKDGEENYKYVQDSLVSKFAEINHIKYCPFKIESGYKKEFGEYLIRTIDVPTSTQEVPKNVHVAVGSLNISFEKCLASCKNRWANIKLPEKEIIFDILRQSYECLIESGENSNRRKRKEEPMFLVLPELCFPIYWIQDLIRFAKRAQIGIVTGLQYLADDKGRRYNYILTILPFVSGKRNFKNAFLYVRDKNDYSPIEFEELAKLGFYCKNRSIAEYQIFKWNGIRLSPLVCYELTDIMARALLKGTCDFVAAPVFNPDTTYFSNIIDSAVRDLHAFVVQANTSFYGDSRITGPYDRDSKDIFKIKGGDNDHVVIGTVNFEKLKTYQRNYYGDFEAKLEKIKQERRKKNPKYPQKDKSKPNIKPFSARYRIK